MQFSPVVEKRTALDVVPTTQVDEIDTWDGLDAVEATIQSYVAGYDVMGGDVVEFEKALRYVDKRRGELLGDPVLGRPKKVPRMEPLDDIPKATKNRYRLIARRWDWFVTISSKQSTDRKLPKRRCGRRRSAPSVRDRSPLVSRSTDAVASGRTGAGSVAVGRRRIRPSARRVHGLSTRVVERGPVTCIARSAARGPRTCPVCGQTFTPARSDAQTCSPKCRTRRYRTSRVAREERINDRHP